MAVSCFTFRRLCDKSNILRLSNPSKTSRSISWIMFSRRFSSRQRDKWLKERHLTIYIWLKDSRTLVVSSGISSGTSVSLCRDLSYSVTIPFESCAIVVQVMSSRVTKSEIVAWNINGVNLIQNSGLLIEFELMTTNIEITKINLRIYFAVARGNEDINLQKKKTAGINSWLWCILIAWTITVFSMQSCSWTNLLLLCERPWMRFHENW